MSMTRSDVMKNVNSFDFFVQKIVLVTYRTTQKSEMLSFLLYVKWKYFLKLH